MYTTVKKYRAWELLKRVKELDSFVGIPKGYWILGVQSNEDVFNRFDDKFYLFKGRKFIMVLSGTTNAGSTGIKHYERYSNKGVLVVKTDEWYYDLWKPGYHRGKMAALRQHKPIKYYRDWNKNTRIEEIGELREGMRGINFHTVIYGKYTNFIRKWIGGWSVGCQVANNVARYYKLLKYVWNQPTVSYCLIKEF